MDLCDCKNNCCQKNDKCILYIKDLERFLKDTNFFLSNCDKCPLAKQLTEKCNDLLKRLDNVKID